MNISNDKKSFYQWETNRFLVDEDFKINQEVCFSSVKLRKALVVKTKLKNNKIVVEVPNLLLQDYHPIMVHWVIADENGKYVTKEQEFQVLKRAKPEDYVYTETEIFSFLDLEQRLKNLEEEGINKAIADYFVKNPIQSGATSEQAAQIIQNKENIEKLNKNKLDADKLPEAINNALAQGAVLYNVEQTLTDEQRTQARANIDAGHAIIHPLIPYYAEANSSGTMLTMKFDITTMKTDIVYGIPSGYTGYKTYAEMFVVVCDDGTEYNVFNSLVNNGSYNANGKLFTMILIGSSPTNTTYKLKDISKGIIYTVDIGDKSTSTSVSSSSAYMLATDNKISYTPTGDYNPATKKYVDDSISVKADQTALDEVSALVGDTSVSEQINNAIVIATDDEILEMLAEIDMLPTVTDGDGSILADENENILLW